MKDEVTNTESDLLCYNNPLFDIHTTTNQIAFHVMLEEGLTRECFFQHHMKCKVSKFAQSPESLSPTSIKCSSMEPGLTVHFGT